ncbi:head-tail connector protein [Psychromonas sp. KJ10-2]|uniref:head-tail connector protein n=1 Tax=Psychromonas sp. KJ10-2 TaxID=3391822 RepID=UPI0039B49A77
MLTLTLVKEHLKIESDDTAEDTILQLYLDASLDTASEWIGIDIVNDETLKPSIVAGCLMFIGTLYQHRADVSELTLSKVPLAVERCWNIHRDHGVY